MKEKNSNTPIKIFLAIFFLLATFIDSNSQAVKVDIKGGTLHAEIYGEGDPILIINGGPGMNSRGFRSLAGQLADKYRVIIFDQRGTGLSTLDALNTSTITMDLMVEDMEILRKALDIPEWSVLGHSFGGMLAVYYASKYPGVIRSMVLSSSGGINLDLLSTLDIEGKLSSDERDSLAYWNRRIGMGDRSSLASKKRAEFLAPAYVYNPSNTKIIAERLTQGNRQINSLVFQDLRRINFDCTDKMKDFSKPVLIIQGTEDIIPVEISEKSHRIFPNSKLVFMEKCGHYGWLDRPDIYFTEIFSFFDR